MKSVMNLGVILFCLTAVSSRNIRRAVDAGEEKPGIVLETPEPRAGKEHNGLDGPFGSNNHVENNGQPGNFAQQGNIGQPGNIGQHGQPGHNGPPGGNGQHGNGSPPNSNNAGDFGLVIPVLGNVPNKIQGGIAQAGSFLERASEILQNLDIVAQFTQHGVGEALQAKQQIIQEKAEAANTFLGLGQEVGRVGLPILANLWSGLKSVMAFKTNLLHTFNEVGKKLPQTKSDEDDVLSFLLG